MSRKEEIRQASMIIPVVTDQDAFKAGAEWSDKHPSWDLITKVWNIAVDITIAQINEEEKEFDSDKEIKDYIKEKLGL